MENLLAGYRPGDGEPTATVPQVVDHVIEEPALFDELMTGLQANDIEVQHRAAAAIVEVAQLQPHLLKAHKQTVLTVAGNPTDSIVQEHVAGLLPFLGYEDEELDEVLSILTGYIESDNMIVNVQAIEALGRLAKKYPTCRTPVRGVLERLRSTGTPYVSKRATEELEALPDPE